ncbi:hypothetical protein QBC38DRAFT_506236 [Podospora fimiseda]|uniref:DUF7702 domain-containing protein n=1 Tax=Podospora fimiseda TaxID=252190 RepID=A0AAN7H8K0_9PEZI|nr:hypothetical protein QBC38DRAFT_506236 [Podospora fimiseda]
MGLSPINAIAAAQIAIYVPYLLIAILLASRHGFRRNAGWLYLLLFTLTRLIAASLQLSTTSTPPTPALLITTQIFYGIGLSTLLLTLLNLLGRLLSSTTTTKTIFTPRHQRLAQIVVVIGLTLGIVGSSLTASQIDSIMSGQTPFGILEIPIESQIGLGLIIAGFAGWMIGVGTCWVDYKGVGEKKLLWGLTATMPFMIVRVVFSGLGTFGYDPRFRGFGGSEEYAWWFLGMAVMMEVIVVGILEGVGLTLKRVENRGSNGSGRRGIGDAYNDPIHEKGPETEPKGNI